MCFNGLPEENISFPAVQLADYAQRKVTGSYLGSRKEMKELLEFAEEYDIQAIIDIYRVSELQKVFYNIKYSEISFYAIIKLDE